jgi:hypothetical protein
MIQRSKDSLIHPPKQYQNVAVQVVSTTPSLTFFKREEIEKSGVNVWTDKDEWEVCVNRLHRMAKTFIVAQLS